jgi:2-dehydropantoate 2-reductase
MLVSSVVPAALGALQITTLGAMPDRPAPALDAWRSLFDDAKIPTAVCDDMPSWLATHAAFMAPLIAAGALCERERTLSFARASLVANAMREGFVTVEGAGRRVIPRSMALVRGAPTRFVAMALWLAFRTRSLRSSLGGEHARDEATAMLDDLVGLARAPVHALASLRSAIAAP